MFSSVLGMQNSQQMMVYGGVGARTRPQFRGLALLTFQPGPCRCLVNGKNVHSYFMLQEVPKRLELSFQAFSFIDTPDDVSRNR